MKTFRQLMFGLVVTMSLALAGCGGGGGGGGGATSSDLDGDGIPNAQDAFPNDATQFASFTVTQLTVPNNSLFSSAVDINTGRQVVGFSDTGSGQQEVRAQLWNVAANGTPSAPVELSPIAGNSYSAAYGINNAGVVVGESSKGADTVAVFWPAGSATPTELQLLTASGPSAAYRINTAGRIVGEARNAGGNMVPVMWTNTAAAPVQLPLLSGGTRGAAYFISADGTKIVGESENSSGNMRAVVWEVNTNGTVDNPDDLGVLTGHDSSTAFGINAAGQIVGESESATGEVHAVLWTPGILFGYNIKDLSAAGAKGSAAAISDAGLIAGWIDTTGSLASLWHALNAANATSPLSNPLSASSNTSQTLAVNSAGYVVGVSLDRAIVAVPTTP